MNTADADNATTEFRQTFTSASYRDTVAKRMEWVREGDSWKIQREQVLEAPKVLVPELMKASPKKRHANKASKSCMCN